MMPRTLLYIIGQPGAGKTSALRLATEGIPYQRVMGVPSFLIYQSGAAQLGIERGMFSGTDALPMNVQPAAVNWMQQVPFGAIVAEGDRLGNHTFFYACAKAGWQVDVVWIDTPDSVAAERRRIRGTSQDATWLKSRATKVRRLGEQWTSERWHIDGSQTVDQIASRLREHCVIQAIRANVPGLVAWV